MPLLACGDSEATQRRNFVAWLQMRIIAKPGVHVPHMTPEEAALFGAYAKHYAVIADFNAGMDQSVSQPLQQAIAKGVPRSLNEVVTRRSDIAALRDGMAAIRGALDRQLASADTAHAALDQPPDLKPVYDTAYDRDVSQPAKAFRNIFPELDASIQAILELAEFLDQHKTAVQLDGAMIRVTDPALQPRLQALVEAMRTKLEAMQKAQQRMNALVNGT